MKRRAFLGMLAAASLPGCSRFSLEQGVFSACHSGRTDLLRHPVVEKAWRGVRADLVWDAHAHLFGNGRNGSGIYVDPDFDKPRTPQGMVRRTFFMNGGCVGGDEDKLDQGMVARLAALADELPRGAKVMLLAFDFTYDEDGRRRDDLTTFAVPNAYARRVARERPDRFEWVASVHPYRPDALQELERAHDGGARAMKWLPPSMNIDPANRRCRPYYEALRRLDMPLLVHIGEEQAVAGAERHELANPLLLRHALEAGVRVVAAHCATLGESADIEAKSRSKRANFELFSRLMDEPRYKAHLFGDISAITQSNRAAWLPAILARSEWHGRLINGSDYPLPGIMPLFSINALVSQRLIDEDAAKLLRELREANALMFDFVLKRSLEYRGARLPASAFETRDFFMRTA